VNVPCGWPGEVSSGGRAAGTDDEELAREVENLRQSRVSEIRRNALERLKQAGGRPEGLGIEGLEPVLAALREAQVEALFVDTGTRRSAKAWIGPEPTQIADDEGLLRELGITPIGPVDVDSALVRAAAG